MTKKIVEFEEAGKDTTMLENWLNNFKGRDGEEALDMIREDREKVMDIETPHQGFEAMKDVRRTVEIAVRHTR